MSIHVKYNGTLQRACAPEQKPSSGTRFKLTKSQQLAKQPAVPTETKATREMATVGSRPGMSSGAMSAPPQTVTTMGKVLSIFDPTRLPGVNAAGPLAGPLAAQYQAASGAPTATNAEPQEVPTVEHATIDRPSVATATKVGHGPPPFNCSTTVILLTGLLTIVVALGSIFTAPVGLFGDSEGRMICILSILWAAVSMYLQSAQCQCCCACTVNNGQLEGNAANWIFPLFRTFVSIDTMMASVEFVLRSVAFDACVALYLSVCQVSVNAVVGIILVDESENRARKIKIREHCAAVRRRCCPSPSALVIFALALFCGIDHGWVVVTPNASQSAQAKEVLLASFAKEVSLASFENNGTVLDGPIPIVHPSTWGEIDPTSIVGQGRCPEGQNQGTF